jgi:ABC-type uncharacterized transport system involved in gliding motility auxiliary subunit
MDGEKIRRSGMASSILTIVFLLAILVIINLIALKHSIQFDVTSNKRFTLSPQTHQILENLSKPVHAYSFYRELDEDYETVKDLLGLYQRASQAFSFEWVDADKNPSTANQFDVTSYNTIVLQKGDRTRKVTEASENALTNALIHLIQGDTPRTICFSTGNGEYDIDSMDSDGLFILKMALQNANYQIESVNLMSLDTEPSDCDILAVIGPAHDPVDAVIDRIRNYLLSGGCLFIALESGSHGKFGPLLAEFGIEAGADVIIDPKGYQNILQPIVETYPAHEITKGFSSGLVFHVAGSLSETEPLNEGWSVQNLAMTSEHTYAKTDLEKLSDGQTVFDAEHDIKGPLPLAVTAEKMDFSVDSDDDDTSVARIVAVGDADFTSNMFLQTFAAHQPFVMNIFHWLADEKDLIALPPREDISQPLMLQNSQLLIAFFIPVVFVPLSVAVFGIVRIVTRRRRA